MSTFQSIINRFRSGDHLQSLLLINIAVFLIINIYLLFFYVSGLRLPAFLGEDMGLAASSSLQIMLHRPYSLLTHMFAHSDFGHFLFNMIALYTMGRIFLQVSDQKKLAVLYVLGGLAGYLLFFAAYFISDKLNQGGSHYILGASAAVMAISVAAAVLDPQRNVFLFGAFKVELRWLAGILVLLDLASIRHGVNSGGHIGHIGGALFGLYFAYRLKQGSYPGAWLERIFSGKLFRRSPKMTVVGNHKRPKSDEEFNAEKISRQKKLDQILDKINSSGYDSLTAAEKEFLFKNSDR